jgi:hypothetical protein
MPRRNRHGSSSAGVPTAPRHHEDFVGPAQLAQLLGLGGGGPVVAPAVVGLGLADPLRNASWGTPSCSASRRITGFGPTPR